MRAVAAVAFTTLGHLEPQRKAVVQVKTPRQRELLAQQILVAVAAVAVALVMVLAALAVPVS
jgi:hypothetical protein